jgi:transposase
VLSTGCQWRYVPKDLPPKSTLFGYFDLWNWDGTLDRIHHALYVQCREAMDREASPTACVIDSQSVKSAEKGGRHIDPTGYDAGKKIKGKKRHILVDTLGLLLHAVVHPADIQDRDGGMLVLSTLFGLYPFLQKLFTDGGYQGPVCFEGMRRWGRCGQRRTVNWPLGRLPLIATFWLRSSPYRYVPGQIINTAVPTA